jgi:H+/Cl- antiporter ClcA
MEESWNSDSTAREAGFWGLLLTAAILGVIGAVSGIVFLAIIGVGENWYGETSNGWFDGHWWWIAVSVSAGVIVAGLRRWLAMPDKTPGLIEDLSSAHIDTAMVPKIVAVSAVSLIGGASIGPEVALGQLGGGAGGYIAKRRGLDDATTKENTLSGMGGAFGGLFSSPFMATALIMEVSDPPRSRFGTTFYATVVSSTISFGIYFAVIGSVLFGALEVAPYDYENWHILAGAALGLLSAAVVHTFVAVNKLLKRALSISRIPSGLLPICGGLVFGFVGVMLPLTNFTGTTQLNTVLEDGSELGVGLLVATLIGKMVTFAISTATGFIGGPIFPILFLGGTTGVIVHEIFPDVPLALAFTCMLAAVPGSMISAPFSMVLLVVILTQVGPLQTAPILIAVATSFLAYEGVKGIVPVVRATPTADAPPPPVGPPGSNDPS